MTHDVVQGRQFKKKKICSFLSHAIRWQWRTALNPRSSTSIHSLSLLTQKSTAEKDDLLLHIYYCTQDTTVCYDPMWSLE